MKTRKLTIALMLLGGALTPIQAVAMPPADAWEIGPVIKGKSYSIGMPRTPAQNGRGDISFEFPTRGRGEVDAMTTGIRSLAGARTISMRYRIEAASGVRFAPSETPNDTATISLYFQRRGDNWSAKGRYASYRWYAPSNTVMPITPGEHTITVQMDDSWTNVYGQSNSTDADGFAAAMEEASRIGIAFGSAGLRSHGVYSTGKARFVLLDLDIS